MKKEVIEKLVTLITAAFGLVAALAWNSAIQAIFKNLFGEISGDVHPNNLFRACHNNCSCNNYLNL